jgi:HSP20 family protein
MSPTGNDPYRHLARLRDRIDSLFEAASTRAEFDPEEGETSQWSPLVDLYETGKEVVLVAEVPGLSMEDLDVQVTASSLTLRGERRIQEPAEGDATHHRMERSHGSFSRTFNLTASIDRDAVTAEYRLGLLKVVLPKQKKTQARTIPVSKS